MRMIGVAGLVAVSAVLICAPAQAQWVWGVKGNDTGGIIGYSTVVAIE